MSTADAPRAILTTRWDIFTAGGGTFLILPLLLFPFAISRNWSPSDLLWIPVIINYPHFMASYRLLYTKRNIRKHPIVAIWVPLALIGYILFTLSVATTDRSYVMPFLMVGSAYLAVHYTGQAWGVMVTYSFVDGDPFEPRERRLIRASLYMMMAWHVLWAIELPYKTPGYPLGTSGAQELYFAVAFAVGTYGLYLRQRRSGRRPTARVVLPWAAVWVWYIAIAINPAMLLFTQMFHALQYLAFTTRVEINRYDRPGNMNLARHLCFYAIGISVAAYVIVLLSPDLLRSPVTSLISYDAGREIPYLVTAFINIHHYFTDGAMWKLGDPEVRNDLMRHLKPARAPR